MTDYEQIGRQTIEALKERIMKSVKDTSEIVYCDLCGLVLNAEQYCQRLDSDYDFAKRALEDIFVLAQPSKLSQDRRISVREQRHLATEVAQFYNQNGMKSSAFYDFVASRPVIAAAYDIDDLAHVRNTLHIEHNIKVNLPTQEFLDDVCRRNSLAPHKG